MKQSQRNCISVPNIDVGRERAQSERATTVAFQGHLPALDGLRGIAILMVLFHHVWPYVWENPAFKLLSTVKHVGWIGVDLFFVLSGFLITGILIDTRNRPGYFRNFIARRSLRVFPLYYIFLLISFTVVPALFSLFGAPNGQFQAVLPWSALYVSNYLPLLSDPTIAQSLTIPEVLPNSISTSLEAGSQIPDYLSVTWSLCVEEQFYLIWPVFILLFGRYRLSFIGTVIVCIIACRTWSVTELTNWQQVSYMSTFCRADSLLIGAAIASYIRSEAFSPRWWLCLTRVSALAILPSSVLWIIFAGGRSDPVFASFGYTAVAIGFSGWLGMSITRSHRLIRHGLSSPVLRWFGKYSYGLYLFHMIVLAAFEVWHPAVMSPAGVSQNPETFSPIGGDILVDAPVRTVLVIGISMGIAWLSYRFLERPFLGLKCFFSTANPQEKTDSPRGSSGVQAPVLTSS